MAKGVATAPHGFSATAWHHLAAIGTGRVRFRPQCLAIDRSWASARAASRQWGEVGMAMACQPS
jgi:hypothetical protein